MLRDAALGNPEKSDVEIVEPLALRRRETFNRRAVFIGEVAFLFYLRDSGIAVVRRIAEDDENRALLLDLFGVFALATEFLEDYGLRMFLGNPAGEGIGQINPGAMIVGERSASCLQKGGALKGRNDKGRVHDLG